MSAPGATRSGPAPDDRPRPTDRSDPTGDAPARRADLDHADPAESPAPAAPAAPPATARRRNSWPWGVASVVVAALTALVPLTVDRRWYFIDDTATGAYGVWYHLGTLLRSGDWPVFDPTRWTSGNFVAEGQWGLWNPLVMAIGLGATLAGNVVVFSTLVKVAGLALFAGGTYLLAREYGARPGWAFLAAVTVPYSGFTVFFDAASWVTGLLTSALLPWCWWGVRRALVRGRNPLPGLVAVYLFVTIGYVYAVVVLAVVLLALAPAGWRGGAGGARRSRLTWLAVGVVALALVVTTYLPQLLTAGVTVRDTVGVDNDFTLRATLSGLVSGVVPTSTPAMRGFWDGPLADNPLASTLWFLPALAFVRWREVARRERHLAEPLAVAAVATALAIGPSNIGPFRHLVTYLPYVSLGLGVPVVVLLSRHAARPGPGRLAAAAGLLLGAAWIGYADAPSAAHRLAFGALLVLVGLVLVWLALRSRGAVHHAATALAALLVAAVVGLQVHYFPSSSLTAFDLPSSVADYRTQLAGAEGTTLVIGAATADLRGVSTWDHTLVGNAWYLNPHPVVNEYTTIAFDAFTKQLCMAFRGETCPQLLDVVFRTDPRTGASIADELGVSSLLLITRDIGGDPTPPAGWSVRATTADTALWVRDTPVELGGIVRTTAGTRAEVVRQDARSVTLRVDAVGADGGQVLLSRLAWPGYGTTLGTVGTAGNDWSLQLSLPADSAGREVTVAFRPPGWSVVWTTWVLALVVGAAACLVPLVAARRRRAPHPSVEPEAP